MNLRELLDHTRFAVLRDKANPSLWSTDEVTLYLNEAQDIFARRTHVLTDEESDFTFITTEPGEALYRLDPKIIFVAAVYHADTGQVLRSVDRRNARGLIGESRPVAYSMNAQQNSMRVTPTPDEEYVLDLTVARKPLKIMSGDSDTPEIPEDYHLSLCDWAAYRALDNNDSDGGVTIDGSPFRAKFEIAVRDAKRDVYWMRTGPNRVARSNWTGQRC